MKWGGKKALDPRRCARTGSCRSRIAALLPVILAGLVLQALPTAANAQAFDSALVSDSTLPNGLHLVLKRSPGAPLAAISIWIKAGSRNETRENNGVAHLLEHYLFGGKSSGVTEPFERRIEGMGGNLNAETTRDDTHFYMTVPTPSLEGALKVLANMLLHPELDAAQLEIERRRAADEVEQHAADPILSAQQALFELAYKLSPYRLPVAGTGTSVGRLSRQQIRTFYDTYYRPDNSSLVVVGDIDMAHFRVAATDSFGSWLSPHVSLPPVVSEPGRATTPPVRFIPLNRQASSALLMVGFPAPSVGVPRDAATTDVIFSMVSAGGRSLLAQDAARSGLLKAFKGEFLTTRDPGLFFLWGFVRIGELQAERKKIAIMIAKVADGNFTDEDLLRGKRLLTGSYALESETAGQAADDLGFYDAIASYAYAVHYEETVQSVTREDIMSVAHRYFDATYTVVMGPVGMDTGG